MAAGRYLTPALFWYAAQRPAEDYRLEFRLMQGEEVVQRWGEEIAAEYPTRDWREGEVVFGRYRLRVDEGLAEGRYDLWVAVMGEGGQELGEAKVIADLAVRAKLDAASVVKAMQHPLEGVTFDGRIGLLGYDLSRETLKAGETVSLVLYWECREAMEESYTVFAHLLDGTPWCRGRGMRSRGRGERRRRNGRWGMWWWIATRSRWGPRLWWVSCGWRSGFYDAASGARLRCGVRGDRRGRITLSSHDDHRQTIG